MVWENSFLNRYKADRKSEELEKALEKRYSEIGEETLHYARQILRELGERAAANFLAMHERINDIYRFVIIDDPEKLNSYIARTGEAKLGERDRYGQRYTIDFEMETEIGKGAVRSG